MNNNEMNESFYRLEMMRRIDELEYQLLCEHSGDFKAGELQSLHERIHSLKDVDIEELILAPFVDKRKTCLKSYFLGIFGVDRFALHDKKHAIWKLVTLGGFGVWWIVDAVHIRAKVEQYNHDLLMSYLDSFDKNN